MVEVYGSEHISMSLRELVFLKDLPFRDTAVTQKRRIIKAQTSSLSIRGRDLVFAPIYSQRVLSRKEYHPYNR